MKTPTVKTDPNNHNVAILQVPVRKLDKVGDVPYDYLVTKFKKHFDYTSGNIYKDGRRKKTNYELKVPLMTKQEIKEKLGWMKANADIHQELS